MRLQGGAWAAATTARVGSCVSLLAFWVARLQDFVTGGGNFGHGGWMGGCRAVPGVATDSRDAAVCCTGPWQDGSQCVLLDGGLAAVWWCSVLTSMPNNNLPYRHHAVFEGLLNSKGLPDPTTRELTPEQKRRR